MYATQTAGAQAGESARRPGTTTVAMSAVDPADEGTFDDGGRFRIEIASVERPDVLQVVVEEATRRGVHVNRVSQGSGV